MRGLPIEEPLPQRRGGRRLVLICITIACIGTVICVSCTRPLSNAWSRQPQDYDPSSPFPRKIWQTLDDVNASPNDYLANLSDSWKLMNPEYRYELLTVKSALTFIEEDLEIEPDLVDAVEEKQGHTIFPELVRALIMLAHGGVYAHADSQCSQPIDAWIPCELTDQASLVVGIELDPQEGRKQYGALFPVQLSNWTFMAKPGSPPLRYIMETMLRFAEEDPTCDKLSSTRSHAGGTNVSHRAGGLLYNAVS